MSSETPTPDERAKRVWSLGSYSDFAPHFLDMAGHLVESTGVTPNDAVLDIGCGTGNAAITAARREADVTGVDIVPDMLDKAEENATMAGVGSIDWREGSATDLPFDENSFDVTLSCVGHVFGEPPEDASQELLRVTRPGGRIGFTSWTPSSVVADAGRVMAEYLPSEAGGSALPVRWGDPEVVRERIGHGVENVEFETGTASTPVLSPTHYFEKSSTASGPVIAALGAIEDTAAVREELIETVEPYFDDNRNVIRMEYRLTTATVK